MQPSSLLDTLCNLYGIAAEYEDIWGKRHPVSEQTRIRLLATMGVPAATPADMAASIDQFEQRQWHRWLAPVTVLTVPQADVVLTLPDREAGQSYRWQLQLETGETLSGQVVPAHLEKLAQQTLDGRLFGRYRMPLPQLPPLGYHRFHLANGERQAEADLIVAPAQCYLPEALAQGGRTWGLTLQLYALRSRRNWGIGDFTDLKRVIDFSARQGADLVGLNPLHALYPDMAAHASPYSPSSRLFLNVLYLDIEAIPDYAESQVIRDQIANPEFQARLRALRADDLVDYTAVAAVKMPVLGQLYAHFRQRHLSSNDARGQAFRRFQQAQGERLRRQALFDALHEHFHQQDAQLWGWPVWPQAYQKVDSAEVRAFAEAHPERIEFFEYLQWQAARQLRDACTRATQRQLGIGLYQDLAVGVHTGGADVWADPSLYALGASIGAPPDELALQGQNWGLPPFIPHRLYEAAYQPYIAMLRENMQFAGALRIDHVMGLMRLFWVPEGQTADQGTYVSYPFRDLMAILALESQRNQCLVIGEDLGTVPQEIRDLLGPMRVLSYRPLFFQKTPTGEYTPPTDYPRQALVAVSTHDLPTLKGFWQGVDLEQRSQLDLYPSAAMRARQVVERAEDRARLLLALEQEGLLPPGADVDPAKLPQMTPELARAVHAYLALTPALVMAVQVEDLLGVSDQANLPGTVDEHPNWRRKLPASLDAWQRDPEVLTVLQPVIELRQSHSVQQAHPVAEEMACPAVRIPSSTYRLQFNHAFTFADAEALVPYLHALGISHLYASPYLRARPGSMHGYDIVDHNALNPEIGTPREYDRLVARLHHYGMGQLLDIVPNHIGVGADNARWMDVLENGQASLYAGYFDIDWQPLRRPLQEKVMLPVLGDYYGNVLESGQIQLTFDCQQGIFSIHYFDHRFPVDPATYPMILEFQPGRLAERVGSSHAAVQELQNLIAAFGHLPDKNTTDAGQATARARDKEVDKRRLAELCEQSPDVRLLIEENVQAMNGRAGDPDSFDALHRLLEQQAYRLSFWRVAMDEINYRRFFDVNELAGLRMENPEVFDATHALVRELLASGKIDGLRIDHPDGLYDPLQYFNRLQELCVAPANGDLSTAEAIAQKPLYVVLEKILVGREQLPQNWPVHGTTGYDFCNLVNGVFVDPQAAARMDRIYANFIHTAIDFDELLYKSKKQIMNSILASELNVLADMLSRIAQDDRHTRDFARMSLRNALHEVVACFPVYRTYVAGRHVPAADRQYIDWAVERARKKDPSGDQNVFDFVHGVLTTDICEGKPHRFQDQVIFFAMKFQQYTGPVMAKGMEDTAFYNYNRLISLNDVGSDPRRFGVTSDDFHHFIQQRQQHWPYTMLATSTHDSKRSEDVRMRIDALSEMPDEWRIRSSRWQRLNRRKKHTVNEQQVPTRNDEYLLYQTLIGAWPLAAASQPQEELVERICRYMTKAVREAKRNSSWITPNQAYEDALSAFIRSILDREQSEAFLDDFLAFQAEIALLGMYNSLSQTLLKLTVPGVPDIYQGNDLWDFSLVDPDNRRPVDYALRRQLLAELQQHVDHGGLPAPHLAENLLDRMETGQIKQYVTWRCLNIRQQHELLFRDGDYLPVPAYGSKARHLLAFARVLDGQQALVAVPRLFHLLGAVPGRRPLGAAIWEDTWLDVTELGGGRTWRNVLTGECVTVQSHGGRLRLPAAALYQTFPYALLLPAPA